MDNVGLKVLWSSWCSQCGSLKQSLSQNGIAYTPVDVDDENNYDYVTSLRIKGLPVTVVEVGGVVKGKIQGLVSVASLRKAIDDILEGK